MKITSLLLMAIVLFSCTSTPKIEKDRRIHLFLNTKEYSGTNEVDAIYKSNGVFEYNVYKYGKISDERKMRFYEIIGDTLYTLLEWKGDSREYFKWLLIHPEDEKPATLQLKTYTPFDIALTRIDVGLEYKDGHRESTMNPQDVITWFGKYEDE